uniref:Uncharacterized protein n=1 Tax=viral metagenome TaxID=1070528 RepID=A0A6M3LMZ3_9ZZZZ
MRRYTPQQRNPDLAARLEAMGLVNVRTYPDGLAYAEDTDGTPRTFSYTRAGLVETTSAEWGAEQLALGGME